METERITLSQRERDRLKVLHEVKQKHLSQVAAAERLKVTDRQVRRMLLRIRERGDSALVHGLRGRPSNRKLAARLEQKILARLRQRYADFGPTLAAEHLAQEGLSVSRETLRKWMTKVALWRPRSQRVKAVHVWRERRACFGELVMQDSSPFRWLEDRGPACQLIALIDDATSRIGGRFTEQDTTEENLRTLQGWVQRYRRPLAHYTDKNSIFQKAGPQPLPEQLRGDPLRTQFGRALNELWIAWIAAHSPQAKGRIERLFETLQDRLVKELRMAGIDSESFPGDALFPRMGTTVHGGPSPVAQCASTTGPRTAPGRNSECAHNPQGGRESHCQLGRKSLESIAERRLCGASWSCGRDRTAVRWKSLVALPRALSAPTPLPRTVRLSASPSGLRPPGPAERHQGPRTKANPNTMCLPSTPGENHGPGHFYLAKKPDISTCVDTS
jgi:transposase